jgi:hypothetical protein
MQTFVLHYESRLVRSSSFFFICPQASWDEKDRRIAGRPTGLPVISKEYTSPDVIPLFPLRVIQQDSKLKPIARN